MGNSWNCEWTSDLRERNRAVHAWFACLGTCIVMQTSPFDWHKETYRPSSIYLRKNTRLICCMCACVS